MYPLTLESTTAAHPLCMHFDTYVKSKTSTLFPKTQNKRPTQRGVCLGAERCSRSAFKNATPSVQEQSPAWQSSSCGKPSLSTGLNPLWACSCHGWRTCCRELGLSLHCRSARRDFAHSHPLGQPRGQTRYRTFDEPQTLLA